MSNLLSQASLVMIPSGYKEDIVYSPVPTNGSGDLSFTRASNGTRINSAGLVEVTPWNLVEYSEDFSQAPPIWNKYQATISSNTTTAPNGTLTADSIIDNSANDVHIAYQDKTGIVAGTYTISIYAKANTLSHINLQWYDGVSIFYTSNVFNLSNGTTTGANQSIESVGNGWYRCIFTFTTTVSGLQYPYVMTNNGTSNFYVGTGQSVFIWGYQLNIGSTAKPYFPTTDRLNVPRLTYQNGGGGCPSLLLEKQSTNLTLWSEDFTQWTASNATVTANNTTSPDGTQNADRIQFTGAGYLLGASQGSGTVYTISCYAKRNGSGTQSIGFFKDGSGTVDSAWALTSDWQRFTYTYTASNGSYSGIAGVNGGDVFVWGAQLEASSYPTSYIPTTTASATRVADAVPSKSTLLADKNSYSMFLDFYPRPTAIFAYFFIQLNSSDSPEIIWGGTSDYLGFSIYDYTVSQTVWTGNINDDNRHKICLSVASGKIDLFVDGVQVVTQKSTSQTGFDFVALNGNPGIYKINEMVILSKITSAEAIALTTL